MNPYQHILLAADLQDDGQKVAHRARQIANAEHAKLSIIHVIEPVTVAYGGEVPIDLSDLHNELYKRAEAQLAFLSKNLGIDEKDSYLTLGSTEKEILKMIETLGIDLIVMGTHSRRGFARLLGSTTNAILREIDCDILSVRL